VLSLQRSRVGGCNLLPAKERKKEREREEKSERDGIVREGRKGLKLKLG